jgi:hypothetical protein
MKNWLLALGIIFWSMPVLADTEPVQPSDSGEIIKYETKDGGMLTAAEIDWSAYTEVALDRATVEFRENWVEDQKRVFDNILREADLERIKSDMSNMLHRVLNEKVSSADGYTLSDENGKGVLRFTPRIVKLDIYQPGKAQDYVGHVLVDAQGSMVITLDITDSFTGKLLASSWNVQVDPEKGFMWSSTSGGNRTAFGQMMKRWANWYFELFDIVRSGELLPAKSE